MRKNILITGAAVLLSIGASTAYAQDYTRPDADVRALQAPVDGRPGQLEAQSPYPIYQGRSVYRDQRPMIDQTPVRPALHSQEPNEY